jgi:hypothetical protein
MATNLWAKSLMYSETGFQVFLGLDLTIEY